MSIPQPLGLVTCLYRRNFGNETIKTKIVRSINKVYKNRTEFDGK